MGNYSGQQASKKLRVLTVSLIFSGVLNIGLIVACLYNSKEEKRPFLEKTLSSENMKSELSIDRLFSQMKLRSFSELVTYLTNQEEVTNGYQKRDLALGALVTYHDFHVEKAISGVPLERREISLRDGTRATLFPGVTTNQFDAIIRFAYEEKWPLTSYGLYQAMGKNQTDKTLQQAFSMTPEFRSLELLFQKLMLPREKLIRLIIEGSWSQLERFAKEQSEYVDVSAERRRSLLVNYASYGSETAAMILVETDSSFLAKKLDEESLVKILALVKEKTPSAEMLLYELLRSPRSKNVWLAALKSLYAFEGKELPSGVNLREAMAQFVPVVHEPQISHRENFHIVKEGETFWKIAKMYNIKVEDLEKANQIDKNHLRVGMKLNIP